MAQQYACPMNSCAHYIAAKNRKTPKKGQMTDEQIDWDHLYRDHLRIWGECGWDKYDEIVRKLAEVERERDRIRAEFDKLKVRQPQGVKESDIVVDPINHIDGICDAVIGVGSAQYKCTDRVRHGKQVCAIHLNHKCLVSKGDK